MGQSRAGTRRRNEIEELKACQVTWDVLLRNRTEPNLSSDTASRVTKGATLQEAVSV